MPKVVGVAPPAFFRSGHPALVEAQDSHFLCKDLFAQGNIMGADKLVAIADIGVIDLWRTFQRRMLCFYGGHPGAHGRLRNDAGGYVMVQIVVLRILGKDQIRPDR